MTNEQPKKRSARLPTSQLHTFEGHPFKVLDNEEMDALVESIKEQGILTPLIVRPLENEAYEIVSGHRRLYAAEKAGLTEVPALICPLDRNEAILAVVDSNLHREHILPSEKAFAYKLKMEALRQQGKRTLSQVATKTDTAADIGKAADESRDQVFRYIRLTHLIPALLEMVDEGKIALTPAVELSYLKQHQQEILLEEISVNDCTPSLSQAIRLKKLAQNGALSDTVIGTVLAEEKPNQKETLRLPMEKVRQFTSKSDPRDLEDFVLKACEHYRKYLLRQQDKDR